jgi:hypothetical protein
MAVVSAAIGKIFAIGLCSAFSQAETVGDALRLCGHFIDISPPTWCAATGDNSKRRMASMNGIRTIVCRTALAIAAIFSATSAWGDGEVTVVGASWAASLAPETMPQDASAQPIAQPAQPVPPAASPPAQPRFDDDGNELTEELSAFERWFDTLGLQGWTIDYRYRALVSSGITSTFGTSNPPPTGYAPLSQLNFPINSSWHGIRVAKEEPTWCAHFEWMAPQQSIGGQLSDYDWTAGPPSAGQDFTDLGFAQERWVDAQMIDLGLDFQLTDSTFKLPIAIWPTIGFRWQRFDLTCYDGVQVNYGNQWLDPPDQYPGDVITFNQQFYIGYLGGQLRAKIKSVTLTLQGDWGYTWGYNIDHHLDRAGDMFTMESTEGNTWHLGFTAEVPLSTHVCVGFQCDHLEIRTSGTHRLQNLPLGEDLSWNNGVSVSSNQTSLMAFLRFRL